MLIQYKLSCYLDCEKKTQKSSLSHNKNLSREPREANKKQEANVEGNEYRKNMVIMV
jgi:hypothetical protein